MPNVGDAWYDLTARTAKLRAALDAADRRVSGSVSNVERGFGRRATGAIGRMGGALQSAFKVSAMVGGAGAAGLLALGGAAIVSGAKMESMQAQWETLLGSTEKAQARMNELRKFAATTPFEIPEVMQASRTLQVFGGTALATGDNLRLVGDIASGTQQPFTDVAMWVGRMYDAMKNGQPFGEAAQRLQEMGAMSGANRRQIEKLAAGVKSGNITMDEAWKRTQGTFSQFSGGMERQSKTLAGQWSNLQDNLGQALAGIGATLLPLAKDVVSGLNTAIPTIREFLMGVFEKAEPVMRQVGQIFSQVIAGIGAAFDDNGQAATGFGAVIQSVAGVVKTVIDAWVANWPMIQEVVGRVMDVVGKIISTTVPIVSAALSWIVTNVLPPLLEAFNAIATWVQQNWPTISSIIQTAAGIIGDAIRILWPIIEQTARIVLPILGAAFSVIGPIIATLLKIVKGFTGWLADTMIPIITGVGRTFSTIWTVVGGIFSGIWNGMLQVLGNIVGTMIGIIKNVVGIAASIPGPWQEGAKQQRDALEDMESAARSWGRNTTSTMTNTFDDQLALAKRYGANTGQAYADGLGSTGGYLAQTVYDYTAKARAILAASSPPGPQSPLHDIDTWGARTAEAYAEGFASRGATLRRAIADTLAGYTPRVGAGGAALAVGAQGGVGGSVTVQLAIQSYFPPTPAQAQAAARAVIPEFVRVMRRQRLLPARSG